VNEATLTMSEFVSPRIATSLPPSVIGPLYGEIEVKIGALKVLQDISAQSLHVKLRWWGEDQSEGTIFIPRYVSFEHFCI